MIVKEQFFTLDQFTTLSEKILKYKNIVIHFIEETSDVDIFKGLEILNKEFYPHYNAYFHYLILENGNIIQCIPDNIKSYHTSDDSINYNSISVCLIQHDSSILTEFSNNSLIDLLTNLCYRLKIHVSSIVLHNEIEKNFDSCPIPLVKRYKDWVYIKDCVNRRLFNMH